jgi:hypothetical protein
MILAFHRPQSLGRSSGVVRLCEWNVRNANLALHFRPLRSSPNLFVTVDRVERNRPLALLLMILILGVVALAVLIKVMP